MMARFLRYEYIRLRLDMGDLRELNSLSGYGWHVVAVVNQFGADYALLERAIIGEKGRE